MAKIYQRLPSKNILREKRRDSFDPQRVNLLGEDSICMVILLRIPGVIVFFFHDLLASVVSEERFYLSSEHENQNVATIGTLLDQFMLSCN